MLSFYSTEFINRDTVPIASDKNFLVYLPKIKSAIYYIQNILLSPVSQ